MKTLFTFLFLIAYALSGNAQAKLQRLLVAEYKKYQPGRGNYSYLTAYNYKCASIGTFRARGVFVDNGALATEYIEKESTTDQPNGVKIWTAKTEEWVTFDIPWAIGIIGWIKED